MIISEATGPSGLSDQEAAARLAAGARTNFRDTDAEPSLALQRRSSANQWFSS